MNMIYYSSTATGYSSSGSSMYEKSEQKSMYAHKPKMICCGSHLRGMRCMGCPGG